MVTFSEFFNLYESFDTVSDFLLNPEHRDKRFWDLMKEFEASGGKQIGSGKYGTVYAHPKWPYVIKTFNKDDKYLKFVRFAYKNPDPSFPKFFGTPQKIVPYYTREERDKDMYISRIEKLIPLDDGEFDTISTHKHTLDLYMMYRRNPKMINAHYSTRRGGITSNRHNAALNINELRTRVKSIPKDIYKVLMSMNKLNHVNI